MYRIQILTSLPLLQDALGDVLAKALSAVAKERPDDPVQFVADYLYRKHDDMKQQENEEGFHTTSYTS